MTYWETRAILSFSSAVWFKFFTLVALICFVFVFILNFWWKSNMYNFVKELLMSWLFHFDIGFRVRDSVGNVIVLNNWFDLNWSKGKTFITYKWNEMNWNKSNKILLSMDLNFVSMNCWKDCLTVFCWNKRTLCASSSCLLAVCEKGVVNRLHPPETPAAP